MIERLLLFFEERILKIDFLNRMVNPCKINRSSILLHVQLFLYNFTFHILRNPYLREIEAEDVYLDALHVDVLNNEFKKSF